MDVFFEVNDKWVGTIHFGLHMTLEEQCRGMRSRDLGVHSFVSVHSIDLPGRTLTSFAPHR